MLGEETITNNFTQRIIIIIQKKLFYDLVLIKAHLRAKIF
jgi:hypothetical protein